MKIGHLESSKGARPEAVSPKPKNAKLTESMVSRDVTGGKGAEVEISDRARLMKTAFETAKLAPDIRESKVAAIKSQIKSGAYRVDAEELAEKILTDHLSHDFGKNSL